MLVQSWPLWVASSEIARVPWISNLVQPPSWIERVGIILALSGLVLAGAGVRPRRCLAATICLLIGFVLFDQERFQPWLYQYLVVGLGLASLTDRAGLTFARLYLVGLYVHSGLSKLDVSFLNQLGPVMLDTLLSGLGLHPQGWTQSDRTLLILAMPLSEISIGLGFLSRSFVRVALAGSIVLHVTLIGILGPWGLDHSTNVLVWNGLILVGNVVLTSGKPLWGWPEFATLWACPTLGVLIAVSLLPFLEPWGWFDTWPSHALYASHAERTELYFYADDVDHLPASIRSHLVRSTLPNWVRLDLTALSRYQHGTPLYPQSRSTNGVAEDLTLRYGGLHPTRVLQWGRADRWTGRRSRLEMIGIEAIRQHGDTYWLNAHPSRGRDDAADPG